MLKEITDEKINMSPKSSTRCWHWRHRHEWFSTSNEKHRLWIKGSDQTKIKTPLIV